MTWDTTLPRVLMFHITHRMTVPKLAGVGTVLLRVFRNVSFDPYTLFVVEHSIEPQKLVPAGCLVSCVAYVRYQPTLSGYCAVPLLN